MATVDLTPEELRTLQETLERRISDLEVEVGHTDSREFKDMLRHRKAVLDHLLAKVQGVAVTA